MIIFKLLNLEYIYIFIIYRDFFFTRFIWGNCGELDLEPILSHNDKLYNQQLNVNSSFTENTVHARPQ